jgi:hypothetical protein
MRSKVAQDMALQRARRIAAMSPADRLLLADRLREEGIASFMRLHDVDRATAIVRIKTARRLGRRHSASATAG